MCPVLPVSHAATINVSLGDLDDAIVTARDEPDAVQRMVLEKIQQRLQQSDLKFVRGDLLYQDTVVNQVVEDGCNNTRILESTNTISLAADTGISFVIDSLYEPIRLTLDLNANIDAIGRAQQKYGFRLGNCIEVASDSFQFTANGPVSLLLSLSLDLNPQWVADNTLRIYPHISIDGELREARVNVEVDDTVLRNLIEDFLQDEVDKLLGADRIRAEIASMQSRIDNQLQDSLDSAATGISSNGENGYIDIQLPAADDEQIIALYELLTPDSRFPLTASFLETRRLEILAALVLNDSASINEILNDAIECEVSGLLQTDLQPKPVYRADAATCRVVVRPVEDGSYYSDSECRDGFEFVDTDLSDFCQVAVDSQRLGSTLSRSGELNRWSLSPGTRFDIGTASLQGKQQPYVQRLNYKTVSTPAGECQLEMRVYSDRPNTVGKTPLIAFHGGSWQRRGFGFLGVEHMATNFVDAGFVVFAPFYRLVGTTDGPEQCNGATLEDLMNDAKDALDWVTLNKENFGASGKPVVFGQSSGGHLALSMSIRHPLEISRAVLFYAPTDFGDFIAQIKSGEYTGEQGQRILATVAGLPIAELNDRNPLVVENSYPAIVAVQPDAYPPMYLLHGESDGLLPFRQSARMCNGLSGSVTAGPVRLLLNTSSTSRSYDCDDRGSQLHLIAEGEHTLDFCVSEALCLAGSPASAAATEEAINKMLLWASAESLLDLPGQRAASTGTGSIGFSLLILLLAGAGVGSRDYFRVKKTI